MAEDLLTPSLVGIGESLGRFVGVACAGGWGEVGKEEMGKGWKGQVARGQIGPGRGQDMVAVMHTESHPPSQA